MLTKKMTRWVMLLLLLFLFIPLEALAQEQSATKQSAGKLALGAEFGFQAGTASNDTAFAPDLNADYYLDQYFSVGPLIPLRSADNLIQTGESTHKYTFDFPTLPELRPHLQAGLGLLHVDMDQPPVGPKDSTTGFLVPFGGGLELALSKNLIVGTTLLLDFPDAYIQGERPGNLFMTGFFGLRAML